MAASQRQIGGDNNKRGNRFEDFFAVSRLIRYAPPVINCGMLVRLREQAGCPVDDLILVEPTATYYHQLKADKGITWGEAGHKLELEFLAQKSQCQSAQIKFRLVVVVADPDRKKSLTDDMPADLADCTSVLLFPRMARPSDVALQDDLAGPLLELSAGRRASVTEFQHIVRAFHAAWVDHSPDLEGYCVLSDLIASIRKWGIARLRLAWVDRPQEWVTAESILNSIPGLSWWVDRGYFEWEHPPRESGLSLEPCNSESFRRFIGRLVQERPSSYTEFERLLP